MNSLETVLDLAHQITKAEKDIGLEVLCWDDCLVSKLPEAVIEDSQDLIHTLNVLDTRVESRIDKQDSC